MNLNSRKPFQIGAVSLALTMLACYVVYSQRQVAQSIAPGSKSAPVFDRTAIQQQTSATNQASARSSTFVASGSKSLAPIFTLNATNSSRTNRWPTTGASGASQPARTSATPGLPLHPDSSSAAPVLGLTPDQVDHLFMSNPGMVASSSKSGVVFRPQDVTNLIPLISPHTNTFPAPLPHPTESPRYPTFSAITNSTPSLKP
jgi:hypothetical protein